ncbi:uncharacterized protein LOC110370515 [Helicoverpa armigera]|uniref:uncharacterized protein LOC110370515 n=1 Tax=Helicoverpa armigera TaxID=29058 RepID=UPI003083BAF2
MSILYVKAYHGLCSSNNSFCHKPQFLHGLRDRAQKIGIRIDLVPVPFVDYCMLEMCGHEIFRCKLQNLKFNTQFTRDEVCDRAIYAILSASLKFRRARACLWFWTALDHQLFRRSKYAPQDYWPIDVDFTIKEKCVDCSICCKVPLESTPDNTMTEKDKVEDRISLKSESYSLDEDFI